jgi:hypothetical protein
VCGQLGGGRVTAGGTAVGRGGWGEQVGQAVSRAQELYFRISQVSADGNWKNVVAPQLALRVQRAWQSAAEYPGEL